jgi:ABC-2 type transport system permease protein
MTTVERRPRPPAVLTPAHAPVAGRRASLLAFWALLERDAWVTVRHELAAFLAQSLLQPLFFLFVFGRVLPEIGSAGGGYGAQLLPGVVALTLVLTALQNTALPLVIEFSFTKEIEDRLLAPAPAWMVGVQKVVFAACRGIVAALLVLPLAAIILPGGLQLGHADVLGLVVIFPAGAIAGATIGLVMGTAVPAQRINVVFATVLTPLLFTGATFYPWQSLDTLRWFQVITLANPLTYVSEGLRGALSGLPHLGAGWIALGLAVSLTVFATFGIRGFVRRAID